jgi:hypothetical protein
VEWQVHPVKEKVMPSLSDILSVAIGVTFVFLILSLLTTWVQELIATILSMRANNLADILQNMLDPSAQKLEGAKKLNELKDLWNTGPLEDTANKLSQSAFKAFYDHPIIFSLSRPGALPSYIPAQDFTTALFELLNKAGSEDPTKLEITMENIAKGIQNLQNEPLKMRFQSLLDRTQIMENKVEIGIADFQKSVESWFNSAIERGGGWYKRRIQLIGIITGIIIAMIANADTISMAISLWQNAVLRQAVTEVAVIYTQQGEEIKAQEAQQKLADMGFPIGWSLRFADRDPKTPDDPRDFPSTTGGWVSKVIGVVITGFAISQGSPIWFDLLNRLINLRGTGSKPTEPAKEKSKEGEEGGKKESA